MKTKAKYEIELAASKDLRREVITNVQLDKENNCLVATDGKVLAVVPVKTNSKDVSGSISPAALKSARGAVTKKQIENNAEIEIVCQVKKLKVYGKNGLVPMQRPSLKMKYPNYKQIIPKQLGSIKISFNPEFLLRIAKAIGSKNSVTLEFNYDAHAPSPIAVYPNQINNDAFGVLMPMRLDTKDTFNHSSIKAKYL